MGLITSVIKLQSRLNYSQDWITVKIKFQSRPEIPRLENKNNKNKLTILFFAKLKTQKEVQQPQWQNLLTD